MEETFPDIHYNFIVICILGKCLAYFQKPLEEQKHIENWGDQRVLKTNEKISFPKFSVSKRMYFIKKKGF